jgi:hypothetical protein
MDVVVTHRPESAISLAVWRGWFSRLLSTYFATKRAEPFLVQLRRAAKPTETVRKVFPRAWFKQ